jgi:plasmid replication initiation protein
MEPGEILKQLVEQLKEKKEPSAKLPEPTAQALKHQQQDFFLADFQGCSYKDDQATMEAAVFSLSTKKDNTLWKWESSDGRKTVEVAPGFYGRATQNDKDILIYCVSQLMAAISAGQRPSRTVRFTAYNFLTSVGRATRGGDYDRLPDALARLKGTQITTNIETDNKRITEGFGLIDNYRIERGPRGDSRMEFIEVVLSNWLFNAINAKEVLTINSDYFGLRPIEKRLYEIARKHCGHQGAWEIGIEALCRKCGSTVKRIRRFRDELLKIETAKTLLEYRVEVDVAKSKARFYLRSV